MDSGSIITEISRNTLISEDLLLKLVLCAFIGIIAINLGACSSGTEEKSVPTAASKAKFRNTNKLNKPFHGDMETSPSTMPDSLILQALKNNHLEASSTKTIGEAFDAYKYAIKKEWRETGTKGGPYYIDYICWFNISPMSAAALREGVVKRGMEIKFVIHEDGETYVSMVSRIDIKTDGLLHSTPLDPSEIKGKVMAIYENREITF